ncbi:cation:proton antiporter [Thermostichus vulcanus]|uniref:Cation:proton antiporter n=1 Tax=Thermostichus vulcanus str. 'Rupite' TaxID=2813851 RepID=A0ABT0C947_THEVL|nr:cation:proton antiporter [Thermostichus vulcanus]MCJ2542304.1 cation:proton antiporter [Thermostichus vulcanus str. 'Rupite']
MIELTLVWVALPFLLAFATYLVPALTRPSAIAMAALTVVYAVQHGGLPAATALPVELKLLDHFGVTLRIDANVASMLLAHGLVTLVVALYLDQRFVGSRFLAMQLLIVHGSANAVIISADLISVYVALEVLSVGVFLLLTYGRRAEHQPRVGDRQLWVGLRYLFMSNVAMLFYLMGTVLVYVRTGSFAMSGLAAATPTALALITLGLLAKGAIFVAGLWLPLTYISGDRVIVAVLSGFTTKAGAMAMARCSEASPVLAQWLPYLSAGSAVFGIAFALMSKTPQRLLAWSSVSQMGFVIAAPQWAGLYGLAHGLAKPLLFIGAAVENRWRWPMLILGAASLAGVPGGLGYGAKALSLSGLTPWHEWLLTLVTIGTTCVGVRVLLAPSPQETMGITGKAGWQDKVALLIWGGGLLWGWLPAAYSADSLLKALLSLSLGILLGWFWERVPQPQWRLDEGVEAVIGVLSLVLVLMLVLFAGVNHVALP